ncbi:MAG: Shedu anti-phage system protein SduA domain-containing protein, partial [Paracoccaceae bacterium]
KENRVSQHEVTRQQYDDLASLLVSKPSEREVEEFLTSNKDVLAMAVWMFSTGHHMSWVFPKPEIRASTPGRPGLIPDYLMAGASSDGVEWFALELKGPNESAFCKSAGHVRLSSMTNKGVCQLLSYLDCLARDQAYHRDGSLIGIRQPRGILLIGTEEEMEDPDIQVFKQAWNRENHRLQIRSYHALLRQLGTKLEGFGR